MNVALRCLVAWLAFAPFSAAKAAPEPGKYHLSKKIPIPGQATYYDYLFADEAARRLYVSFGGEVVVIDLDKDEVVGRLTGLQKVHGIAAGAGRLFVTDGLLDLVRAFDPKTLAALGDVKAGANPDAILFEPSTKQVFAFNNHGKSATVFDPTTLKVNATIDLGGAAEFGRADGKGTVWVNLEDASEVVRIDAKKHVVTARWPLAPCSEPTGLAFDAKHRRLFAGCNNDMMAVINADSGKVITTLPIGPGVDATAFDAATGNIFNSCGGGEGSLVVIHQDGADKYRVIENHPTQKRAKTLALDPRSHRVFLTAGTFGPAPAATAQDPKPRAPIIPGSFSVLVWDR
jgi:DNA-binding beta-propeller fold protein YncE